MVFVITQPCIGAKDASCVDVCPVDCIHPGPEEPGYESNEQLYINPNECISCGACEPACPMNAIFEEEAVPLEWKQYIQKNQDFFVNSMAGN
jgi:NAD-dependent dihydropyrimidine dehydrogenase PreA subunit